MYLEPELKNYTTLSINGKKGTPDEFSKRELYKHIAANIYHLDHYKHPGMTKVFLETLLDVTGSPDVFRLPVEQYSKRGANNLVPRKATVGNKRIAMAKIEAFTQVNTPCLPLEKIAVLQPSIPCLRHIS